jgi:ATP-dependent DNA helicase RecG
MNTNASANLKRLSALLRQGEGPALFGGRSDGTIQRIGTKSAPSRDQVEVLRLCRLEQPLVAMMNVVERQDRTRFRNGLVKSLIEVGLLELTIPDNPRSSKQKCRLTEKGCQALRERTGGA